MFDTNICSVSVFAAMILSVCLVLSAAAAALFCYFFSRNRDYWKKRGVVGPDPQYIFGNFKDVILQRQSINVRFAELYNEYPDEKIVGVFRWTRPILLVRDLEILQHMMIRDFDNFVDRTGEMGETGISQNLFMLTGEKWRVLRTRLSPIFTSGKLKNMFHLLDSRGDNFVNYLDTVVEKSPDLDMYQLVQKYTISSISACAFGIDVDMNNFDEPAFSKLDEMIFNVKFLGEIEFLFPKLNNILKLDIFPAFLCNFFSGVIRRAMKERGGRVSNRKDFIDLLMELREAGEIKGPRKYENEKERFLQITDDLIAAQAFVFYAGGYETSASTLGYLLHELALHPDVQDRLVREIDEVMNRYNGELNIDVIKEMTYLGQVFDETLRLYPIVDPLRRISKSAYKIPGMDLTLPKDSLVMVSAAGIHSDERYYPEPHKFDPDRFTPENVNSRPPHSYMPFGLGPRNCIGMRFAKVQSSVGAIKLLQRFRVEPSPETRRHFTYNGRRVTLSPSHGVPLRLVARSS